MGTSVKAVRPGNSRVDGERTIQISLRLPLSWMTTLRQRALAAAAEEDWTVTPQEIMRRIIAEALKPSQE
jgi:hypothetical protein